MNNENTKKLLILTTYFIPMNEYAAVRLKSMIKYLLGLGWEIHVIIQADSEYYYDDDPVLSKIDIYPAGTCNIKKPSKNNNEARKFWLGIAKKINLVLLKRKNFYNFVKKHYKSIYNMYKYIRWSNKSSKLAVKVIEKNNIQMVLSTVPRIEALWTGYRIKKQIPEITLICEYRDLISTNMIYRSIQSTLETIYTKRLELLALPAVDKFIFLTERIKSEYGKYFNLNIGVMNGIVITNGYDRDIYPNKEKEKGDKLVINHIGHLYGNRDPMPLVQAVIELCSERRDVQNSLELNFIGKMECFNIKKITEYILRHNISNIRIIGPVSNEEAIKHMVGSDVNIIITHSTGSEYAIPGKLFEYMGAGRPIIALTGDTLLRNIIINDNLGWVCDNSVNEIKRVISDIYMEWENSNVYRIINLNIKYDREKLMKEFSSFLLAAKSI